MQMDTMECDDALKAALAAVDIAPWVSMMHHHALDDGDMMPADVNIQCDENGCDDVMIE